jgi:hypothetical protein
MLLMVYETRLALKIIGEEMELARSQRIGDAT